jgi:hypothetical protein
MSRARFKRTGCRCAILTWAYRSTSAYLVFWKSTVLQRAGCRWVADLHRLPHRVFGRSQGERFLVHDIFNPIFNPMIFASFTLPS